MLIANAELTVENGPAYKDKLDEQREQMIDVQNRRIV